MARVYANLIIKGVKVFNQVPDRIKDDVKAILTAEGYPELAGDD